MATSTTQTHIFGQQSVAAAGTAEALVASQMLVSRVLIIAHGDNTGQVFIGSSDVDSNTWTGLDAGERLEIQSIEEEPFDLQALFVDAGTNDDGVDFIATRARRGSN